MGKVESAGRTRKISASSGTPNLSPFKYIPIAYVKKVILSELGCLIFIFSVISVLLFFAAQMQISNSKNSSTNEASWNNYDPSGRGSVGAVAMVPSNPAYMGNNQFDQQQQQAPQGLQNQGQMNPQDSWLRQVEQPRFQGQQGGFQPQQPLQGQGQGAGFLGQEPMIPNQPGAQGPPPPQMGLMPDQPNPLLNQPGVGADEEDLEPENVNGPQPMLPPNMQDPRFNNPGRGQPMSIIQRLYDRFPNFVQRMQLPKKAIIMSYNRSGSNFLGELINQNNQSFYWYEPLRINSIWDHRDPSFRTPDMDKEIVSNILNCEIDKLPVEVILDLDNIQHSLSSANYHRCVDVLQTSDSAFRRCKDFVLSGWEESLDVQIPGAVPEEASESFKSFVYLFMDYSKYLSIDRNTNKVFSSIDNGITPEIEKILISWYKNMYRMQLNQEKTKTLSGHLRNFCSSMLSQKAKGCVTMLQQNCTKMSVRAVKTIRFQMNAIPNLLSSAPDVKIIHLIRNPRGILLSAKRQIQGSDNQEPVQWSNSLSMQSTQLCKRLLMDIRARRAFESRNPDNFYQVLYEDLAMEPKHSIDILYEFLNATAPENLYTWVDDNTDTLDAGANKETGKNSFSWKIDLNKAVNPGDDSVCSTLYEELGYNGYGYNQQQQGMMNQGMNYNQQGSFYNQQGGGGMMNQQMPPGMMNQQPPNMNQQQPGFNARPQGGAGFNQPGFNRDMNRNPQGNQFQQGVGMNQGRPMQFQQDGQFNQPQQQQGFRPPFQ